MGFKFVLMALALVACLSAAALGANAVPEFPTEDMSGSVIREEVQEGVYGVADDPSLSF